MDLTLHQSDQLVVKELQDQTIKLSDGSTHDLPLFLCGDKIQGWVKAAPNLWSDENLERITACQSEIVLIGTGHFSAMPEPKLLAYFYQWNMGCEFMNNRMACHTFNILIADQRQAALILL